MQTVKPRPRRVVVQDGPEVAIIRYFRRFPQGGHLGFAKWQRTAERANVSAPVLTARSMRAGVILRSDFGAALTNLLVDYDFPFKRKLYFSGRNAVVLAMIYAMLDEQKKHDRMAPIPKL